MNEKLNRLKAFVPKMIEEMKIAGYDAHLIAEAEKELADEIELWQLYDEFDPAWKMLGDSYLLWYGDVNRVTYYASHASSWILTPRTPHAAKYALERVGSLWATSPMDEETERFSFIYNQETTQLSMSGDEEQESAFGPRYETVQHGVSRDDLPTVLKTLRNAGIEREMIVVLGDNKS